MPADRHPVRGRLWLIAAVSVTMPGAARALPLTGVLDLGYQKVEQSTKVLYPNGVLRDTVIHRHQFSQSYQVNHASKIGQQFDIVSQLQLTDLSYTDRPHARRTLAGVLRLSHPVFGISGTYRPTTTRTAPASLGLPDAVPAFQRVTLKQQEAQIAAYLTPPVGPRVDVSWTRRHRNPAFQYTEETSIQRNARVSQTLGVLDLYAGYGDISRSPDRTSNTVLDQRNVNTGAALRLAPTADLSLGLQYDFGWHQSGLAGPRSLKSLLHNTSLGSSYRMSPNASWNLGYNFRRSHVEQGVASRIDDHEGSLLLNLSSNRTARLTAGGGVRSTRTFQGSELQRYVTAIASGESQLRPGWKASLSGSHVTSWNPGGRPFSTESMHLGSHWRWSRDFQMNAAFDGTLNGDLPGSAGRVVTQASYGFQASPLRRLQISFSDRQYRSGRGLLSPVTASRTWTFDVRCRPLATFDFSGAISRTGPRIGNEPEVTTRQAAVGWRPGALLQLSGTYSRSDQRLQFSGTSQLSGSEVFGLRATTALGRTMTLKAGTYHVDPGSSRSSKQWDLGLTKAFGR